MNTAQQGDHPLVRLEGKALLAGLAGGLMAGLVMGVVLQAGTDLLRVLAAFVSGTSILRGWVVHLTISMVYGALFAVVVTYPPIRSFLSEFDLREHVLVGVTYATMIAAVTIAVLPFVYQLPWAASVDQVADANVPGVGYGGLVPSVVFALAHVVYGGVLGTAYVWFADSDVVR